MLNHLLEKLLTGGVLTHDEHTAIFAEMLTGGMAEPQIAGFLCAWRARGEDAPLLLAGAQFLRFKAERLHIPEKLRPLVDNCGTGGSGLAKFNISTAVAVVCASLGLRIAKHGNGSASGKCGSADLLFACGFPQKLSHEKLIDLLDKTSLTFFFAPNFHPVIRQVMPVRKSLGVRTVFNLLGPLANPIAPEIQLIGVSDQALLLPMAEALQALGTKRALVVHSRDGLDEISPEAITDAYVLENGKLTTLLIDPKKLGIRALLAGIKGGDVKTNHAMFKDLLEGKAGDVLEAVVLNSGFLLWISRHCESPEKGIELARKNLTDGSTKKFFLHWIELATHDS